MRDNLEIKEELVKAAKELSLSNDVNKHQQIIDLTRKWRKTLSEEESFLDKELETKFDSYINSMLAIENENIAVVEERKKQIVEEAKKLLSKNNFKEATTNMNNLFEELKSSIKCSKEFDDQIWEEFRAIKQEFFDKKQAYFDNMKKEFEANKVKKEELIKKAKEVLSKDNMQEANKLMTSIMDEWKKTGSAGKEINDDLWNKFNEHRKAFYEKKASFYEEMKSVYATRAEQKKELIAKAKLNLARSTFSDEEVNEMNEIKNSWKEIGSAGKEFENTLWDEFKPIINKYFDNMKYYR